MECKGCNSHQDTVPFVAYEGALARMERTIRRLWILALVLIGLLLATNAGWIWYESQYETVSITAEQEATGNSNNYAIGGDYDGGASESDD